MSDTQEFMAVQLLEEAGFRDIWTGKKPSLRILPSMFYTWAIRENWVTVVLPSTVWLAPNSEETCQVAREVCGGEEPAVYGFAAHWVPDTTMAEVYEEAAAQYK